MGAGLGLEGLEATEQLFSLSLSELYGHFVKIANEEVHCSTISQCWCVMQTLFFCIIPKIPLQSLCAKLAYCMNHVNLPLKGEK